MTDLVCELILTLDGFASGQRSPAFYGYTGPDFNEWLKTNSEIPNRQLIGRKTYELLNDIPNEAKDEGWQTMATTPGWLFSNTLKTSDWKGLEVVHDDMVNFVRELKRADGTELRTVGSISIVQQLLVAGLVDRLKLVVCPLILPQTGDEPIFNGLPDMGFDLVSSRILDGQVLLLEYRPAGEPPYRDE